MKRTASARLEFDVDGPAEFVLSVAASRAYAAAAAPDALGTWIRDSPSSRTHRPHPFGSSFFFARSRYPTRIDIHRSFFTRDARRRSAPRVYTLSRWRARAKPSVSAGFGIRITIDIGGGR